MLRTQIAPGAFFRVFFELQDTETGKNAEQRSQRTQDSTPEARTNSVEKQYYQKNKSNEPAGLIGLILEAKATGPAMVRQPETFNSFFIDSRRVTAFSKFIILSQILL
jgi:hypothetical protein